MSSFKSFRTRSAHSARENEVLTSGRSIVASAGISGSTFGSRIRTILGRCTRLKVSTISGMPFSAGFTTIRSRCESHMTARATPCRQFKAGTMFHPALANNSPNQKINPKSSSTIKAVGLHFATGCAEGVSGDFYGDGVVYNPNDLSIHQQFQRD